MNLKSIAKVLTILIIAVLYNSEFNSLQQLVKIENTYILEQKKTNIWDRLRENFCLNLATENKYVQLYTLRYKKQSKYLQQVRINASPFLPHIVEQIEQRNMPGELALLPMIESSFNPQAISHMGATGIWQLGTTTGRRFGLNKNAWYDERKDVVAATSAALNYLEYLHKEFDGDWFLALAAYNAGEGRIKRAINLNIAKNKPIDFWSLQLPNETRNFVPKLLALAKLIKYAGSIS